MYEANKVLFGDYPRFVGTPEQWPVFDEKSFEYFTEANEGSANCYARISSISRTRDYLLDKVFLDLDGDVPDKMSCTEMVGLLRTDESFRDNVLGSVVEDVRSLAAFCFDESIPLVGIYSGKGVHVHALFDVRTNPKKELITTTKWLKDECDISTFDAQVLGDIKRLSRVANCRRYDTRISSPTDLYTIPLTHEEMMDITTEELLDWSSEPRDIEPVGGSRPPFVVKREYAKDRNQELEKAKQMERTDLAPVQEDAITEKLELWLEDILQMPCMYERIKTRNPRHFVRYNATIIMFNAGLTPNDVVEVYSRLGWRDFDIAKTTSYVEGIWNDRYVSTSCSTIQSKGLCVYDRGERSEKCDQYAYPGGDQYW